MDDTSKATTWTTSWPHTVLEVDPVHVVLAETYADGDVDVVHARLGHDGRCPCSAGGGRVAHRAVVIASTASWLQRMSATLRPTPATTPRTNATWPPTCRTSSTRRKAMSKPAVHDVPHERTARTRRPTVPRQQPTGPSSRS